ncbi:hypothetical protein ACFLQU_00640, partial [Verrucomicrobiota bacterium]
TDNLPHFRRKFQTVFGRAFYLKAAESWDPITLGVMYHLTGDTSYAAAMDVMLKADAGKVGTGPKADGSRTPLEVNNVGGLDQAWCAAAFPRVPDEWKAGVLWLWNRSAGVTNLASVGKVFERLEGGPNLADAFGGYPLSPEGDSWSIKPVHPSRSLPLTWKAPKFGYYCFRSGWQGGDEFIAQVSTREKPVKGRNCANAGAFRIFGLGHPWVAGPAGPTGFRVQEPCVVLPEDEYNERACGQLTHLETEEDGSGVMTIDLNDVYGEKRTGLRAMAFDYSGKSGAPALVVLVDKIVGGDERLWLWQLPRGKLDEVEIGKNSFTMSYRDASMKATFIAPNDVKIEATRDRVRAGKLGGPNGLFEGRLDRVKARAPAGASFFVVITFQRKAPPEVDVKGKGLEAKITVGRRTVRFGDGKIELR